MENKLIIFVCITFLINCMNTRNVKIVTKKPGLPNLNSFTGHCLRRASATFLVDSRLGIQVLKRHVIRITNFNIFESANNTNETAQLGSTAELPCFVKYPTAALNVTWWKVNSTLSKPLTKNNVTNANDKRFQAVQQDENTHHWLLRIRYTQLSDEGLYECRLEGDFVASIFITLRLQKAHAVIKDSRPDDTRFVEVGSTLRLSCYLVDSIESPAYIFWYKENRMINYDLDDGESIREGRQGSELIFPTAKLSHTGNYSCVPSNADQANLYVRVQMKVKRKC